MFVYIQSERTGKNNCISDLWTVGHYTPSGKWEPESDWGTAAEAGARCHYLNGGGADPEVVEALATMTAAVEADPKKQNRGLITGIVDAAKAALSKAQKVRK